MWETIIVQPFVNILLLIAAGVKNFGLAIVLFTLLIKLLTYPLTAKQMKSTKAMQNLQSDPRYKKIMVKYKNDQERLAQEQMKLYKELGINPMGSCLPTLIQLPIILGLYQSIIKAMAATPYELLGLERLFYNFLDPAKLLPLQNKFLWMDLGQPERLNVFGVQIPVLAIIVVATTFLQSKVMQQPTTTNPNDQGAAMTKAMNLYMPILMGWMAYSLASGLALYFLVSNVAGIVQYGLQGQLDWSKIFPFIKQKAPVETLKPVVIDAGAGADDDDEDEDEDEEEIEPVKTTKPSARSMVKQQRPKMKKK
jgi:YidC/Oxa1 family membrane protein insertase